MWKRKSIILLLVLFLCCLPQVGFCSAEQEQAPQTITISLTQYKELVTITKEQGKRLTMLDNKLQELQLTQPEQLKELSEAKVLLSKAQEQLQSAENSLGSAKTIIDEQNESYRILSKEIKQGQRKAKLNQIKSFLYGAGAMFVYEKVK